MCIFDLTNLNFFDPLALSFLCIFWIFSDGAVAKKRSERKNPLGGRTDQPHAPAPRMHRARMQTAPPQWSAGGLP